MTDTHVVSTEVPPGPQESFTAYAHLRGSEGGVVLTVVRLTVGLRAPETVLKIILDRDGWEEVFLQPCLDGVGMPGASLRHELVRQGFLKLPTAPDRGDGRIWGWRRISGETYVPGTAITEANPRPGWSLPVHRLNGARVRATENHFGEVAPENGPGGP